jgi:hypothetical protein
MALRLRRGTDAERLLITPLEGELIYTTDTKKLYIGDGITVGGNAVDALGGGGGGLADLSQSSINDLADVNADSAIPSDGDVLAYDATSGDWRSKELLLDNVGDVSVAAPNNGEILAYNSGTGNWEAKAVAGATNTLAGLDDVIIDFGDSTAPVDGEALIWEQEQQRWRPGPLTTENITDISSFNENEADILAWNTVEQRYKNTDVIRTRIQNTEIATDNLNAVNITTTNIDGNFATFTNVDSLSFQGDLLSADSSVIVDVSTGTFNGFLVGDSEGTHVGPTVGYHQGDVSGSVFGSDSSAMVDSNSLTMNATRINVPIIETDDSITLRNPNGITEVRVETENARSRINYYVTAPDTTTDMSTYTGNYGVVNFGYTDTPNGTGVRSTLRGSDSDFRLAHDLNEGFLSDETKYFTAKDGKFGMGTYDPAVKLDVRGEIKANNAITPGVYADAAARDAAIPTPVAGMMVYVTDVAKHQGYNGAGWQDLY